MDIQQLRQGRLHSLFPLALGMIFIGGLVFWGIKVHHIRKLMREISNVERELSAGQELWRRFPPLHANEKRALQGAHERLLQRLPEDKDIPRLLEQVSRLAQEYHLSDTSLKTDDITVSGSTSVVAASTPAPKMTTAGASGPVSSVPVRLSFAGDYREIAYFLGALQNLPRLLRVESVSLRRGIPLVLSEVSWKAYYKSGAMGR